MSTKTWLILLAAVAVHGGCGKAPESEKQADQPPAEELEAVWTEAEQIIEREIAKEEAASAVQFPCTLYDKAAAAALLEAELEAPDFTFVNRTENDDSWRSVACSWNSWGSGPSLSVWASRPEHFDGGAVQCFGTAPEDNAAPELGERSFWFFQKSFGWTRLRVCHDAALFEVEIHDGPTDEAAARELAVKVGQRLLEALKPGTAG